MQHTAELQRTTVQCSAVQSTTLQPASTMMQTISNRAKLGALVPKGGLFVELGVAAGKFAAELLTCWNDLEYHGIDRWSDHHDAEEEKRARAKLQAWRDRARLQKCTFENAARHMPDDSCDVVYIDGYAHTGQDEGKTLEQWWSKVKRGGAMAGHDYDLQKWPKTYKAVNYFAGARGLKVQVLDEPGGYATWFIQRPQQDLRLINGSCLMVGNGPSLNGSGLGAKIDTFDEVVRFNDYVTQGFEADCGKKTTLWSCYGENAQRVKAEQPERIVYLHGSTGAPGWYDPREVWRVPVAFYDEIKARVYAASKLPMEQRTKLIPSTGLVLLNWLLERHGVRVVNLAGFDHFSLNQGGRHHYFRPASYLPPAEHDGVAEAVLVKALQEAGSVEYLSN